MSLVGDIIIERWVPYGAASKRKTIVQRAAAAQAYAAPRNVIIQYEQPQVRIVRQFQRLGVTAENPQAYLARYGATLLDAQVLLQQARAAGVVEDIVRRHIFSMILFFINNNFFSSLHQLLLQVASVHHHSAKKHPLVLVVVLLVLNSLVSLAETSVVLHHHTQQAASKAHKPVELVGIFFHSLISYTDCFFCVKGGFGVDAGLAGGAGLIAGGGAGFGGAGFGGSSYESSSFSSGTGGAAGGFDVSGAAFNAADANKDGVLSSGEFNNFVQGGL